jgi:type I restriction enzyme S subunit
MTDRKLSKLRGKIHVKHGFPFKGKYFKSSGPYVVLTPGNFHEEGGFKRNAGKDKCYAEPFPEDYLLKKGDVVVAMTEQTDGLLGSMAMIPEDVRFLHNQRLGLVTSLSSDVDVGFLYHLFKTKTVREQIRRSASGSKVKHTSPERIYDVLVQLPSPFPPLVTLRPCTPGAEAVELAKCKMVNPQEADTVAEAAIRQAPLR